MSKSSLNTANWVVKRNALNEMRTYDMSYQELRLFSVYLSKINPRDRKTRAVRFSFAEFQEIMGLKRPNIAYFKGVAKSLLSKIIFEPLGSGGFDSYTIFNRFKMGADENGEWYIDMDANEAALPMLFDFQDRYFQYKLWNALSLKSANQLRMYEFLKQHEKVRHKVVSIKELKEWLGIRYDEYSRYYSLNRDVLRVCQEALKKYTDISFAYEPYGKKGRGGKILELKFTITKNKDFVEPLSLNKFIDLAAIENVICGGNDSLAEAEDVLDNAGIGGNITPNSGINLDDVDENGNVRSTGLSWVYEERIDFLMGACNNEFSREEIIVVYGIMQEKIPHIHQDANRSHDYLQKKHRELNMRSNQNKITHRFAYFRKLVEAGEA